MYINKCPFCGSRNVDLERDPDDINEPENIWRFVVCHDCGAKGPSSTDVIEAIELWNRPYSNYMKGEKQ